MNTGLKREDFEKAGVLVGFEENDPVSFPEPSVEIDSRKIKRGDIFVALQGQHADGHAFVRSAFENGAACALVSREWYNRQPLSTRRQEFRGFRYLVAESPEAAMQQLAALYRRKFGIPVIGIGGSNGKTTTKQMTASVLGTRYSVHMSEGNLNNHLGVPLTLFGLREKHEIAVIEMGINHPGEMELLAALAAPTHGLLTNIGHEHIEFLRDLDGVAEAETALYRYLHERNGVIFLNSADRRLVAAAATLGSTASTVKYGVRLEKENSIWAEDLRMNSAGQAMFSLCLPAGVAPVRLHYAGRHNVANAVAAAAIGWHFGLQPDEIRKGLEEQKPAQGWKRIEVQESGGVIIVNDTYNANPDSVCHALDFLCELPVSGKRIAVIGDMLELGETGDAEHEKVGRDIAAREQIDTLYTFGELARHCCKTAGAKCAGYFTEIEKLRQVLRASLDTGDALLLKASRGMRLERVADGLVNTFGQNK